MRVGTKWISALAVAMLTTTMWAAEPTTPAAAAGKATTISVQSDGRFAVPALTVVKRPAFGAEAGKAQEYTHDEREVDASWTLVLSFWGATLLTALLTLAAAYKLSLLRCADGSQTRGFTLGARLSLGFGALATLILVVSSLSIGSQDTATDAATTFSDIVADTKLLESIQRDMLMVRMNVKDFLLSNSDQDLQQFSDYRASVAQKLKITEEAVKFPERRKMLDEIAEDLKSYDQAFAQVVAAIDTRNGMVGQLTATAERAQTLMTAVLETYKGDRPELALNAEEAASRLNAGRISFFKYMRSGDPQEVRAIEQEMADAQEQLGGLLTRLTDPTHKLWVTEALEACRTYARIAAANVDYVDKRNELVGKSLDVIGPKIAATGRKLLESIATTQKETEAVATAASRSALVKAIFSSTVALVLAVVMSIVLVRAVTGPVARVLGTLNAVASGDLTVKPLEMNSKDEMGELGRATDKMSSTLRNLVVQVVEAAREVASGATEIAASSEEMARGMQEQTTQVTQISSAIEEMSASVVEVARKSADAANNATESGTRATQGGEIVAQTVVGMRAISDAVAAGAASVQELGKRGEQIGKIIAVINDIADQTNLLALNAAIEAARAGQHGRGFAVVADEVRKLADRTTKATEEIAGSIRAIQEETTQAVERMNNGTDQVKVGVEKAQEAGTSLQAIVAGSKDVATMIQSIAAAAEEQSAASEQVSRNVESISAVSRQATEGASQAASAASQLSSKAEELQRLVSTFRVDHAGRPAVAAAAPRRRAA